MKFTPVSSSSKGNAYLVEAEGTSPLLLEAGIPIKKLREKLNFGLSGLAGCLVSHEHMDHAKAVKDLLKAGVDCYMSKGTAEALGVQEHHRVNNLMAGGCVGPWMVLSVPLVHDAAQPIGFFIKEEHKPDCLLFLPDTEYLPNRFVGFTILAIECNFDADILSSNILSGNVPAAVGHRVRRNHMSLDTVISLLKANDLSVCREIHLLHLSEKNSDEALMIRKVQETTGIPTFSCGE